MFLKLTEKQQRIMAGVATTPMALCAANWMFDWGWFGSNAKAATALCIFPTVTVLTRLGPPHGTDTLFDVGDAVRELALTLLPLITIIAAVKFLQAKYPTVDLALLLVISAVPVMAVAFGYAYWWRKRRENNSRDEGGNG